MKVAIYKTDDEFYRFSVEDSTKPVVSYGEILVRVEASSLNYHDLAVVTGQRKIPEGLIPLNDGAGTVEAVGEGVTEFAVGDRVMSRFFPRWVSGRPTQDALQDVPGDQVDGFATDYVSLPARAFTRIPAHYSMIEAAALPCAGLTAWRALFVEGRVRPGTTVVTQGTGGLSIFALQFAKAAGARVISTTSSEEKAAKLTALGADVVINYRDQPRWGREVIRNTDGRGADLIVEVGGGDTLAQSVAGCRVGGQIAMIGALDGATSVSPMRALLSRNITLSGLSVASRDDQMEMVRALETIALRPVIDRVFPIGQIAEAFAHQKAGRHFGKIGLTIGGR